MLELIMAGSWGMIPIVLCSILMVGIVIERFWSLRMSIVIPPGLGREVCEWAVNRRLDNNHLIALQKNSLLGEILATILRVRHLGRDVVRERVEDVGRHIIHQLSRFMTLLGTIALISPLLGLLGTVIGLIRMFLAVLSHGVGDAQYMAGGIGEALICTAAGMVVAIPAYIFHRYFRSRINHIGILLEREAMNLMDSLESASNQPPIRKNTK